MGPILTAPEPTRGSLAVECRQSITAIADKYNITIYDIVHCNNFMLGNMFWQKFGCLVGFILLIYLLLNRTRSTAMHTGYIHIFNSKLQTKTIFLN